MSHDYEPKTLEQKGFTWATEVDIVRLMLQDARTLTEFEDSLLPSYFRQQLRPIVEAALKYWKQYRKLIPSDTLAQDLYFKVGVGFTEEKQKALFKTLDEITEQTQAPEYNSDALRNFIKFQALENAWCSSVDVFDDVEKTKDISKLDEVYKAIEQAKRISNTDSKPALITLDKVESESVQWLWHPYIPLGKLTILEGDPGCGKSSLITKVCASLTNEELFFNEASPRAAMNVLFINREDGVADTIKPRFEAMGGVLSRFHYLQRLGWQMSDTDSLDRWIAESEAKLVVIDPLQSFFGEKDMYRPNEVRPILDGLGEVAKKHKVSILIIRHLTKDSKTKAGYRGMGSVDFTGAARSVLLAGINPNDPSERAFVPTKNNLAEMGSAVGYRIGQDQWGGYSFEFTGESELTANELLAQPEDPSALEAACEFLSEQLKEGQRLYSEITKAAKMNDISYATLRRAKSKLKVQAKKVGSMWIWSSE